MEILVAAAAAALLSLIFPFIFYLMNPRLGSSREREKFPPSPPGLPFIGNLHQIGDKPYRSFHTLAQKHGPVMLLHFGCIPAFIVSSAEAAEEFLITQGLAFSSRPTAALTRRLFYNRRDVIFAPQGQYWREARKLCALHLLSATKVQSFRQVREEEVSLLLDRIADGRVNLGQLLNSFTSNLIRRIALGNKCSGAGSGNHLCKLVEEASLLFGNLDVRDCLPSLGWWANLSGLDAKVDKVFRSWDAFLDEVMRDHECGAGDKDDDSLISLVDMLLSCTRGEGEGEGEGESFTLTKDDIKAILKDILSAGQTRRL